MWIELSCYAGIDIFFIYNYAIQPVLIYVKFQICTYTHIRDYVGYPTLFSYIILSSQNLSNIYENCWGSFHPCELQLTSRGWKLILQHFYYAIRKWSSIYWKTLFFDDRNSHVQWWKKLIWWAYKIKYFYFGMSDVHEIKFLRKLRCLSIQIK